jgi:hypothetical protein
MPVEPTGLMNEDEAQPAVGERDDQTTITH